MALRQYSSTKWHILRSKKGEAHTAEQIAFQPPAGMASSNLQDAVLELRTMLGQVATGLGVPAANFYRHIQAIPAQVWTVNHGLGFRPAVTMSNDAGVEVDGVVKHINENTVQISFIKPVAGEAELS
jgi:hypothetical protein